ncbi:DUF2271 domain-containing protein [Aliamphritea ceti]|uniref:DUF2271 domain-containing protein n=1 Tax=Aliamphritea ceti TaxID=1524258 RepID=UPI0021C33E93|nr:DUF2271 domain-containing protein [Aliamphritea ceti]
MKLIPFLALLVLVSQPVSAASQVEINFSLPVQTSHEYRRPYVSVWVESGGKVVRNLALWIDEEDWLKDLRRWWRKSGRYLDSVDSFSGATRKPGDYQLYWDGLDDQGQPVAEGEYLIVLEASREHGNRSLQKQRIQLGGEPQIYQLKPGTELGEGSIKTGVSR